MLKGRRVVLTQLNSGDVEALFRWINDPNTVKYSAPYRPVNWRQHRAWFKAVSAKSSEHVVFAIRTRRSAKILGIIQLVDVHPVHRSAELLMRIGENRNRGRGYGKEALGLALAFAWRDLNLNRVWLRVLGSNARAIKAYRGIGMRKEGRLRRSAYIDGKWEDEIVLGILRSDRTRT
jgi:RimJ/RimL family protein N-acetyltransferase